MYDTRLLVILFLFAAQSLAQSTQPAFTDPARQLQTLSRQARKFLDRQQPDSAFTSIRPGLSLLRQIPDTAAVARQFRAELVSYYTLRSEFTKSIGESKTLIRLCRQANDRSSEGQARQSLVVVYSNLGMYQECISELLQNLTLFQQPQNLDMLAKTYNFLAWAYQQRNDVSQADYNKNDLFLPDSSKKRS